MSNLVGGMPGRRGGGGPVVDWSKIPWMEIAELAQANPGVPTCHESLQNVTRFSYIAEAVKNSDIQIHGGNPKKNMTPLPIVEVLNAAGGHFTAWSRTTTPGEKDLKVAKGNVWIQWDPDRAGA